MNIGLNVALIWLSANQRQSGPYSSETDTVDLKKYILIEIFPINNWQLLKQLCRKIWETAFSRLLSKIFVILLTEIIGLVDAGRDTYSYFRNNFANFIHSLNFCVLAVEFVLNLVGCSPIPGNLEKIPKNSKKNFRATPSDFKILLQNQSELVRFASARFAGLKYF